MKEFDATFDNEKDGYHPAMPGKYPGHVSSFEAVSLKNGGKVFNIEFTLADECKKMEIQKMVRLGTKYTGSVLDDNGEPDMINAGFMSAKIYRSAGVFLTPNLPNDQRWKNRKYKEFFSNMGVEFPTKEDGRLKLHEVEEEDVIGLPALVDVQTYSYKNKDGEEKTSLRVLNVFPWNDGTRIQSGSEKVPF
jgi:hypothetical protein